MSQPSDTMRALTFDIERDDWDGSTGLTLDEVSRPRLDADVIDDAENVVLRVIYAGFCGSDRGIWSRQAFRDMIHNSVAREVEAKSAPGAGPDKPLTTRVVGHELVGEIVEAGALARKRWGLEPGMTASTESHIICGRCFQCRIGATHVCADDVIIGISRDGCFAEYVKLPARVLWPVDPKRIRPEVAAIMEPFGNAIHSCQAVDLRGKTVAIFGTGTIGLFTVLGARALGAAKIFGIEPARHNQDMARRLGCDEVIPLDVTKPPADPARSYAHDPEVVKQLHDLTRGIGVDVAIEMSGHNTALNNAIKSVRRGGDVLLFGIKSSDFTIEDYHRLIMNGISLHAVIGRRIFETWSVVQHLLESPENRIQDRIWSVILREGDDTIVPLSTFEKASFEKKINAHPKVLIDPRA